MISVRKWNHLKSSIPRNTTPFQSKKCLTHAFKPYVNILPKNINSHQNFSKNIHQNFGVHSLQRQQPFFRTKLSFPLITPMKNHNWSSTLNISQNRYFFKPLFVRHSLNLPQTETLVVQPPKKIQVNQITSYRANNLIQKKCFCSGPSGPHTPDSDISRTVAKAYNITFPEPKEGSSQGKTPASQNESVESGLFGYYKYKKEHPGQADLYLTKKGNLTQLTKDANIIARIYGKISGMTSKRAILNRSASMAYDEIKGQCESDIFYDTYRVERSFYSWFQLSLIHIWMLISRTRVEGNDGTLWAQDLLDIFWRDVEDRIVGLGITNPLLLNKEMKKLSKTYYGVCISYDEGLILGDTYLADALWRNFFSLSPDARPVLLHSLTKYIRIELGRLFEVDGRNILEGFGYVDFGLPPPPLGDEEEFQQRTELQELQYSQKLLSALFGTPSDEELEEALKKSQLRGAQTTPQSNVNPTSEGNANTTQKGSHRPLTEKEKLEILEKKRKQL